MTYPELREAGMSDYKEETFLTVDFLKLEHADTGVQYYVPESFIDGVPTIGILKYPKLALTVDLGVVSNADVLADLPATVVTAITDAHDEFVALAESDVTLMEYAHQWLSAAQIASAGTVTLPVTPNIYSENRRLTALADALRTRIIAMEYILQTNLWRGTKTPAYVKFNTPGDEDNDNLHFQLQIATDAGFAASTIIHEADTAVSITNWMIYNGTAWEAFDAGGLVPGYYGNLARYLIPYDVLNNSRDAGIVHYTQVRAYDGTSYTGWNGAVLTSNPFGDVSNAVASCLGWLATASFC